MVKPNPEDAPAPSLTLLLAPSSLLRGHSVYREKAAAGPTDIPKYEPSVVYDPRRYLQVRGSLEGLVAQAAHVAAVLAVRLATVAPQRVGVLAQQAAVVALVTAVGLRLDGL